MEEVRRCFWREYFMKMRQVADKCGTGSYDESRQISKRGVRTERRNLELAVFEPKSAETHTW